MATAGTLEYLISINSSQLNSGLSSSEKKVKGFGDKLSSWAVAKGQVLGKMIEKAGKATTEFVKGSVKESRSFDKSMSQVAATLGKSTSEIQDLSKFAREMGSKTAFTAQEAAEGLNYMALAGYDAQTSMKMLPIVLDLAAAGNMGLADASDMVTDAQSALGLSIDQTTEMVDQMAKTSSKTNANVQQLGEAFLTVGGTAKKLKGGTVELSALLGVLANNGIKGAEGGTALRNVLNGLSNPAGKAAKQLKQLGIEAYDTDGNLRSMPKILTEMNNALSDKTMKERTRIFAEMFNVRDLKSVEALLSMTEDKWSKLMGEIGDSKGAASKMADTQLQNLEGDVTKFKSALGEAKLTVVEGLTPSLRNLTQAGTNFVTRITNAFKRKGLIGALKEARDILKTIRQNVTKYAKQKLSNYFGLGDDGSWTDIAKQAVKKLTAKVKEKAGAVKVGVAHLLGLTDANGKAVDDPSDVSWLNIGTAAFNNITGKIKEKADKAKVRLASLLGLTDAEGNAVDDPSDVSWTNIGKTAFTNIKDKIKDASGKAKVGIAQLLGMTDESGNVIDDPSDTSWADIASNIIDKLGKHLNTGGTLIQKAILGDDYKEGDPDNWKKVGGKISGWLGEAFKEGGILSTLFDNTSEKLTVAAQVAGDLMTNIATWISDNPQSVTGIIDSMINGLSIAIPALARAIGKILGSKELWTSIGEGMTELAYGLVEAVFGKEAADRVRSFFGLDKEKRAGAMWDEKGNPTQAGKAMGVTKEYAQGQIELENEKKALTDEILSKAGITRKQFQALQEYWAVSSSMRRGQDFYNHEDLAKSWDKVQKLFNGQEGILSGITTKMQELGIGDSLSIEFLADDEETLKKIAELKKKAEELEKTYTMNIVINQSGNIPEAPDGGSPDAKDQGYSGSYDPSNFTAKGNWNVPYDNYPALLHRGEMVLNKSQARQFRDGEYGGGFSAGEAVSSAVEKAMNKVYVMLNGNKVGDLTTKRINKNINATSYSKLRAMGG